MDRLHNAEATTISLDSFRILGSSYVPVRGILCLTPHHVYSMRWVCAPVFGSTKFRLWLRLSTCRSWTVYLTQGPTNAMHVFVRRATCYSIARYAFKSPRICFRGTKYEKNREHVAYLHSILFAGSGCDYNCLQLFESSVGRSLSRTTYNNNNNLNIFMQDCCFSFKKKNCYQCRSCKKKKKKKKN